MWPWSKIAELNRVITVMSSELRFQTARAERLQKQLAAKEALLQTAVLRDPKNGRLLSKRKASAN